MWNLFYRDPRLLAVTVGLIVVAGLAALGTLPRMEDPRFTNRGGLLVTRWPGASAERVEALVARKLEDELRKVQEIKNLISSSRDGVCVMAIELDDRVGPAQVDEVWSRVRDRIDDSRPTLPPGASDPLFSNDETYAYTLIVALVWDVGETNPNPAILGRLAEELEDRLRSLPGTEHTRVFGAPDEEIRVEFRAAQLAALGLTAADVSRQVQETDAKVSAGYLRSPTGDFVIEVQGEVDRLERVRDNLIRSGDGVRLVRLGDIATVHKTVVDPPAEIAWIGGKPAVAVAARVEPGRRVDLWATAAARRLEEFRSELSAGIELKTVFDQSAYTRSRLSTLALNFALGLAAVAAVILVTMGWRSALVVISALPLSALIVLAGMQYLGIPMHQMSVTGLIIALGLLIDNAIVMVDETRFRLRSGAAPAEAITASVKRLATPLLGSTLTTVLAFLPIFLMSGGAGEFVGSIALTVILSLAGSLFLALTVVPALAARLFRPSDADGELRGAGLASSWRDGVRSAWLEQAYRRLLHRVLGRPLLGVGLALALPVLGFIGARDLVEQFFPPAERDQFQVQLRLPRQTPIAGTREYARAIRDLLLEHDEIREVHWFIGNSAPIFYYNMMSGEDDSSFFAQALVEMRSARRGVRVIREVQDRMDAAFPDAQILALQLEQGPPFQAPVELRLLGPDLDELARRGDRAREILSEVPDVIHTRATIVNGHPRLWLNLDEESARLAGFHNRQIARQLEGALEGSVGGSLLESTEELPIRIRLEHSQRGDLDTVRALDLYSTLPTDGLASNVPLAALGEFELRPQRVSIQRRDGERTNAVLGYIRSGVLPAQVMEEFRQRLAGADFRVPPGYRLEWGGESEQRDDAVALLSRSVAVLLVLMVATLVLSLGSFRLAAIIGVVAAGAVGLGLGSLRLFGYPFGFMAIIGTMGLVGVAINDAIVVLAALREDPGARRGELDAVVDITFRSTRHVLSTTLTTAAGFLPLILSGGGFWPPLATVMASGVMGATAIALTFVPAAFLRLCSRARVRDPAADGRLNCRSLDHEIPLTGSAAREGHSQRPVASSYDATTV